MGLLLRSLPSQRSLPGAARRPLVRDDVAFIRLPPGRWHIDPVADPATRVLAGAGGLLGRL